MQVSPRIMNVAVPLFQHSPMFGQLASSQTVFRPASFIKRFSSRYRGLPGGRTRSHGGFRVGRDSVLRIGRPRMSVTGNESDIMMMLA